jgi:hypothetical protein|tara:strand:+ start:1570 stop:1938 length:369 start_codon:yes stop_codon:yes gene_type:complete
MKIIQNALSFIAVLFGLVTIFAGSRVLLGSDPGHVVFLPLLIYNTAMGIVYVSAGIVAFRNTNQGMRVAAVIFVLNIIVLTVIYSQYREGGSIAIDSLKAMSFRTVVWLVLFVGLGWINHRG